MSDNGWFLIGGSGDGEVFSVPEPYSIFKVTGDPTLYFGLIVRHRGSEYRVAVAEDAFFVAEVAGARVAQHLARHSGIDYDSPLVRRLQ